MTGQDGVVDLSAFRAAANELPAGMTDARRPIAFHLAPAGPIYLLTTYSPELGVESGVVVAAGPIEGMPMIQRILDQAQSTRPAPTTIEGTSTE